MGKETRGRLHPGITQEKKTFGRSLLFLSMLTLGFTELALQTVNAWTLESNQPSIKVLTRNHFQLVGRQRRCHRIDGHAFDRLLFDVLRTDHMPK
jgi:RimJ/RimL family protein N-acetyltransferase